MSQYNKLVDDPSAAAVTRDWVKSYNPYVAFYGPSGAGKTTLMGTLFGVADYRKVLYIDADQGDATIEQYTSNDTLCDARIFDEHPDRLIPWMCKQLAYAETADCGSIVIEGLASIHAQMVGKALASAPTAEGRALQRLYIEPTMRTTALMQSIRHVKQARLAAGKGVPLVVTLNTKQRRVDPNDDSKVVYVPDWSDNLTERMMRGVDGFVELSRGSSGVHMLTMDDPTNRYRKLRQAAVAIEVQRQSNLSLPGLFALWATTIDKRSTAVDEKINQKQQA